MVLCYLTVGVEGREGKGREGVGKGREGVG